MENPTAINFIDKSEQLVNDPVNNQYLSTGILVLIVLYSGILSTKLTNPILPLINNFFVRILLSVLVFLTFQKNTALSLMIIIAIVLSMQSEKKNKAADDINDAISKNNNKEEKENFLNELIQMILNEENLKPENARLSSEEIIQVAEERAKKINQESVSEENVELHSHEHDHEHDHEENVLPLENIQLESEGIPPKEEHEMEQTILPDGLLDQSILTNDGMQQEILPANILNEKILSNVMQESELSKNLIPEVAIPHSLVQEEASTNNLVKEENLPSDVIEEEIVEEQILNKSLPAISRVMVEEKIKEATVPKKINTKNITGFDKTRITEESLQSISETVPLKEIPEIKVTKDIPGFDKISPLEEQIHNIRGTQVMKNNTKSNRGLEVNRKCDMCKPKKSENINVTGFDGIALAGY